MYDKELCGYQSLNCLLSDPVTWEFAWPDFTPEEQSECEQVVYY